MAQTCGRNPSANVHKASPPVAQRGPTPPRPGGAPITTPRPHPALFETPERGESGAGHRVPAAPANADGGGTA